VKTKRVSSWLCLLRNYVLKGVRGPVVVLGLSVWYIGLQCGTLAYSVVHWPTVFPNLCCTDHLRCAKISWAPYVTTECISAIPLYLLLNKLHLFILTQHSCVLGSIKRGLIIYKHNGMAAIKPAVTCQYYSISRYTNLKRKILKRNSRTHFNKQCVNRGPALC
jgi:hypothetical protein